MFNRFENNTTCYNGPNEFIGIRLSDSVSMSVSIVSPETVFVADGLTFIIPAQVFGESIRVGDWMEADRRRSNAQNDPDFGS